MTRVMNYLDWIIRKNIQIKSDLLWRKLDGLKIN